MDIQLDPITQKGKRAFSQLINLYNFNYDFTNYLDDEIPEEGFYYADADYYMTEPSARSFFIRADGRIAGYVVIMTGGCKCLDESDAHNIDEFFVTRKFRLKGVGKRAARIAFDMHRGKWEVCQMQDNIPAQLFWQSVISEYTDGHFEKHGTPDEEMVGFTFDSSR